VAVIVLAPALAPNVQEPTVAIPEELVVEVSVVAVPSPVVTAKVTEVPWTTLPPLSLTITDGGIATFVETVAL
jgi:hypothetical protein